MHPNHTTNEIPYGYCQCGCGQLAPISPRTDRNAGWVKGQPKRFLPYHHHKVRRLRPAEDRFWANVNKRGPDECWEWQGGWSNQGYGIFSVRRRRHRAHRYSWELSKGPIPDGLHCLHRCDNPPCVNPAHLFLGTHLDNVNDMLDKGRGTLPPVTQGEAVGAAKLTEQDVRQIRQRFAKGESRFSLAEAFGIHHTNVWLIVKRKTWRHVK